MQHSSDVAIHQFESIISVKGVRLIGKTKPVQRSVEPLAASISRENPARPIPSVGSRC
jgi:hypothetical protein